MQLWTKCKIREELLFAHWWGAGLRAGIAHARLIVPSLASTLSSLASMLALYCENRVPPVFKNHAKEERRNHQPEFFSDNFLRQFPNIKFESFTHLQSSWFLGLWTEDLHHWLPWFCDLKSDTEIYHQLSWFSSLQTADCRTSWLLQPCELVPIIFSSVSLYILFVLFLWTTLINTLTLILTERDYTAKYTRLTGL
ncbi:uncharacterized protein LOC105092905 isoform X2 [Camelus dromedarius]|uniref:uncharacterized protein LOC105092905 isoform X2 n=1 Tax=Camelus dromedarius TaxID=9838 RepID=UPI003119BAFA